MISHPNKSPFMGILTRTDEPSDKAPMGARGHRVMLTKTAALEALPTLIGMGINIADGDWSRHNAKAKIGIIETTEIIGREVIVTGYLFGRDVPDVIGRLEASAEEWGMSYEVADAHVDDIRAATWTISKVIFTGAAILLR